MDIVGKIKTLIVNLALARSNSMNRFYAHINVTEPYCRDANIKGNTLIEMVKSLLDMLKSNILPKCPVKGHVGPIDVKIDSTFIQYFPMPLSAGRHYLRFEFFTDKMESIFYAKYFYIIKLKFNSGLTPFESAR
jgi:hypothetical protein